MVQLSSLVPSLTALRLLRSSLNALLKRSTCRDRNMVPVLQVCHMVLPINPTQYSTISIEKPHAHVTLIHPGPCMYSYTPTGREPGLGPCSAWYLLLEHLNLHYSVRRDVGLIKRIVLPDWKHYN